MISTENYLKIKPVKYLYNKYSSSYLSRLRHPYRMLIYIAPSFFSNITFCTDKLVGGFFSKWLLNIEKTNVPLCLFSYIFERRKRVCSPYWVFFTLFTLVILLYIIILLQSCTVAIICNQMAGPLLFLLFDSALKNWQQLS